MRFLFSILACSLFVNVAAAQTPAETLAQYRQQYPQVMSEEQLGDLLNRVAYRYRADGMRLLGKPRGGATCPLPGTSLRISCDFLVHAPTLSGFDVLTDNGTANAPPTHNGIPKAFDWGPGPEDLRDAIVSGNRTVVEPVVPDSADTPNPGPVPGPAPAPDTTELLQRVTIIQQAVADIRQQLLEHETAEAAERKAAGEFREDVRSVWRDRFVFLSKYVFPALGTAIAVWQGGK